MLLPKLGRTQGHTLLPAVPAVIFQRVFSSLIGVYYSSSVFICISLIVGEMEYLFIYLFSTRRSFPVNSPHNLCSCSTSWFSLSFRFARPLNKYILKYMYTYEITFVSLSQMLHIFFRPVIFLLFTVHFHPRDSRLSHSLTFQSPP